MWKIKFKNFYQIPKLSDDTFHRCETSGSPPTSLIISIKRNVITIYKNCFSKFLTWIYTTPLSEDLKMLYFEYLIHLCNTDMHFLHIHNQPPRQQNNSFSLQPTTRVTLSKNPLITLHADRTYRLLGLIHHLSSGQHRSTVLLLSARCCIRYWGHKSKMNKYTVYCEDGKFWLCLRTEA